MKSRRYDIEIQRTIQIQKHMTREELRRERRWQIAENVVNVLLGIAVVAAMFWAGYLVGSGAFAIGG